MAAVALAFSSSVAWGVADFLGGLLARRHPVVAVLLLSQCAGLAGALVLVLASGDPWPGLEAMLPAAGAGVAGACALAAFYRALAIGTMSIVAPISATAAVVPVVAGVAAGDRPSALQAAGIGLAFVGVLLATREAPDDDAERAASARRSVLLALVAALGFGLALTGFGAAADEGVEWSLLTARCMSVPLVAAVALVLRPRLPRARDLPALGLVGLLDVGANGLFALASTKGLLAVVGVLGSLYPVVTVILARIVLREAVERVQEAGVVIAFAGVGLIAAG